MYDVTNLAYKLESKMSTPPLLALGLIHLLSHGLAFKIHLIQHGISLDPRLSIVLPLSLCFCRMTTFVLGVVKEFRKGHSFETLSQSFKASYVMCDNV